MLGKRILTALVGVPAAVYIINFGQWLFAAAVFLLAMVAWHEFSTMLKKTGVNTWYWLGLAGVSAFLACGWSGDPGIFLATAIFLLIFALVKTVTSQPSFTMTGAAFTVMGAFYIGLPFACMILLRFMGQAEYIPTTLGTVSTGTFYLWLAFVVTWSSDTFAYFAGTMFGKHKLCPAVSPAKTWEGALGGLLGSILAAMSFGILAHLPLYHFLILGLLAGIFAPFGDLVESALKRFCSVKDSGGIFPGQGGVLDRFDAVMFAVPVVYYYVNIFLK